MLFLLLKFGLPIYTGRPNLYTKNNISADGLDKADGFSDKQIQIFEKIIKIDNIKKLKIKIF